MDENSDFYGESLSDAKEEFAAIYERHLLPAVKESFNRIVREGNSRGIEWVSVCFERVDSPERTEPYEPAQLFIVFTANGRSHRLILQKALIFGSQWKVSQFIELV